MKLIHPRNLSGDGSSANGDYCSTMAVYHWVAVPHGKQGEKYLQDRCTGVVCGFVFYLPLHKRWAVRVVLDDGFTAFHEVASERAAKARLVNEVWLRRRPGY